MECWREELAMLFPVWTCNSDSASETLVPVLGYNYVKFQGKSNWNLSRHLSTFSSGFDSISTRGKHTGCSEVLLLSVALFLSATGSRPPAKKLELARFGETLACRNISLARSIHCLSQYLLFLCPNSVTILWTLCVYIPISDTVQTVYELPSLPNNTAVKHFYTNRSGAKCWLDIYRWSAGLAVTVPIRDIGQNGLQSAFETGSSSSSPVTDTFCSFCIPRGGPY